MPNLNADQAAAQSALLAATTVNAHLAKKYNVTWNGQPITEPVVIGPLVEQAAKRAALPGAKVLKSYEQVPELRSGGTSAKLQKKR
jgi:hypothetical protein